MHRIVYTVSFSSSSLIVRTEWLVLPALLISLPAWDSLVLFSTGFLGHAEFLSRVWIVASVINCYARAMSACNSACLTCMRVRVWIAARHEMGAPLDDPSAWMLSSATSNCPILSDFHLDIVVDSLLLSLSIIPRRRCYISITCVLICFIGYYYSDCFTLRDWKMALFPNWCFTVLCAWALLMPTDSSLRYRYLTCSLASVQSVSRFTWLYPVTALIVLVFQLFSSIALFDLPRCRGISEHCLYGCCIPFACSR